MKGKENDNKNKNKSHREEGRIKSALRRIPLFDTMFDLAEFRKSKERSLRGSELSRSSLESEQKKSPDAKTQSDSKRGIGSLLDRVLRRSSKNTSQEMRTSGIASAESAPRQKATDQIATASVDDAHQTTSMTSEYIIEAKSAAPVSDVGQDTEHIVEVEEFDATDYESSENSPETFMSTTDEIELRLAEPRERSDAEEMKAPDEVAPPPPKKVDKEDLPLITPEEAASMMDKLAALDNSPAPNASTTTSSSDIEDTLAERVAPGINAVEPEVLSVEEIKNTASVRPVAVDEPLEGHAKPKEPHPVLDELNFAEHKSVVDVNRDEIISELDKLNVGSASGENVSNKDSDAATSPTVLRKRSDRSGSESAVNKSASGSARVIGKLEEKVARLSEKNSGPGVEKLLEKAKGLLEKNQKLDKEIGSAINVIVRYRAPTTGNEKKLSVDDFNIAKEKHQRLLEEKSKVETQINMLALNLRPDISIKNAEIMLRRIERIESNKNIGHAPNKPLPKIPTVFQKMQDTSKKWDENIKQAQERVDKLQVEFENAQDKLFKAEDDGAGPEKVDILQKQVDKMEDRFVKAIAHLEKAQEMKTKFDERKELMLGTKGSALAPAQASWTSQGSASKATKPDKDAARNLDQESGAKTPKSSH